LPRKQPFRSVRRTSINWEYFIACDNYITRKCVTSKVFISKLKITG